MNNKKMVGIAAVSVLVVVLMMSVLGACAPTPAGPKTLKIGGIGTLSGPISEIGLAWQRGWQLCFDKINEEGGLKIGDDTYMIQFIMEDNKMSGEGAVTAATKLVYEDGVKFLMGDPVVDWITAPIYSVTSKAGVLHAISYMNVSASTPGSFADVGPDKPLAIRLNVAMDECFRPLFEYLAEAYPDVKTISFTIIDFPEYGPFAEICTALAEEVGLKVVGTTERFSMDTQDFYPVMTPVLENNPDAVFSIVALVQHGLQLKAARELGFTGPLFYPVPADPGVALRIAGPGSTDLFGAALAIDAPNMPAQIKEIEERWQAKYAEEFVSDAVFAWDVAWILAQTIEKSQSLEPQVVLETFETLTAPGSLQSLFGPAHVGGLKTNGVNRVLVKPTPISRLIDGQGELAGFYTNEIP